MMYWLLAHRIIYYLLCLRKGVDMYGNALEVTSIALFKISRQRRIFLMRKTDILDRLMKKNSYKHFYSLQTSSYISLLMFFCFLFYSKN